MGPTNKPLRRRPLHRAGAVVALAIALAATVAMSLWSHWSPWSTWRRAVPAHPQAAQRSCTLPAEPADWPLPGMVWVPGGSFEMGDDVYAEEQPLRRVSVDGYWMSRTEVSNDEFAAFVAATGYLTVAERPIDAARQAGLPPEMRLPGAVVFVPPPAVRDLVDVAQWWRYVPGASWRHPAGPGTDVAARGAWPVVAVTIDDALAYARWKGHALPSEVQWEWAARAGQPRAAQDHAQPAQANTWQGAFPLTDAGTDGHAGLAPVGCYAPNALGLHDMIGNAWELTRDLWRPHHATPAGAVPDTLAPPPRPLGDGAPMTPPQMTAQTVPPTPMPPTSPATQHVIKGGSFLCAPDYCARYRSGARQPQDDDLGTSHLGFRTILIAPGP